MFLLQYTVSDWFVCLLTARLGSVSLGDDREEELQEGHLPQLEACFQCSADHVCHVEGTYVYVQYVLKQFQNNFIFLYTYVRPSLYMSIMYIQYTVHQPSLLVCTSAYMTSSIHLCSFSVPFRYLQYHVHSTVHTYAQYIPCEKKGHLYVHIVQIHIRH